MLRRSFIGAMASAMLAGLAPQAVPAEAAAGPVLRFATVVPSGSGFHQRLLALSAEWQKGPGGARMDIYAGTQGGESQIVRRLRVGQIQGAMLTSDGLGEIEPGITALQYMPMMFRSWEEVDYARDAVKTELEARLAKAGYVVLIWGDAGWVRFFSKTPIRSVKDLKSMRVFASLANPESFEMLRAYYTPVALDPDKILLGLRNGMIDALPVPASFANFGQVASQAPYMLDMRWAPVTGALIVTRRAWDALDAPTREWIKGACDRAGPGIRQSARAEDDAAVKAMQDKQGLKVTTLTPEADAEWRSVVAREYPSLRGKVVPADTFDRVSRAVQEYRASHK
jgi:TRAP-type C4-dicarboxylate transport system substrate-binding protein